MELLHHLAARQCVVRLGFQDAGELGVCFVGAARRAQGEGEVGAGLGVAGAEGEGGA